MKFCAGFADLTFEIDAVYPRMKEFCGNYLINEYVNISDDAEGNISENSASNNFIRIPPVTTDEIRREASVFDEGRFREDYLELLAVQRKISELLPLHQRMLMHGAVISYNDKAYMFTALSGTGKSTHIQLWRKYLGDAVQIVNGDKPFLWIQDDAVQVYGTPWCGKEGWNSNCRRELAGICIVCRGTVNRIERVNASAYLLELMKQVYMPSDSLAAGLTLELLDRMLKLVPVYRLECDMSEEAVKVSFEGMTGFDYEKLKILE